MIELIDRIQAVRGPLRLMLAPAYIVVVIVACAWAAAFLAGQGVKQYLGRGMAA